MTVANINKLIDYCIKLPEKDEYDKGYKYPYYSCELLCSVNGLNIDKLLSTYPEEVIDNNNHKDESQDKNETKEENNELNNIEKEKEEKKEEVITNDKKNEINNIEEIQKENDNKKEEKNEIINENKNASNENKENKENIDNKQKEEQKEQNTENNNIKEEKEKNETEINTENKEVENKDNSNTENKDSIKDENVNENKETKEKDEGVKMDIEEPVPENNESKEEKEPNISLVYSILEHIFSFLDNKSAIENNVLSGYFNKIVNYLIKTKTKLILAYLLFQKENIIPKLIQNINKISISNIISNILNALTEENSPEANEEYMIIVNECIDFISKLENNNEDDFNTVELICDLIINHIIYNNKIKFSKIIDANIITKIEKIIIKFYENYEQNSSKILCLINLLSKLNKSLLSNFMKKITTTKNSDDTKIEMLNLINSVDRTSNQFVSYTTRKNDFKELVYNSFQINYIPYCNSINNIGIAIINNKLKQNQNNLQKNDLIISSYTQQPLEKYKFSNLIEFDFIVSIIDVYVNLYNAFFENEEKSNFVKEKIVQLTKTNFSKFLLDDYLKYKQNNFLSNIMLDLIKIVFENNIAPKELLLNILQLDSSDKENNNNTNLITLIINDLINNTKYNYENSNNKTNQLLFSNNIMILKLIFSSTNPNVIDIISKMEKEKFFYKYFIANIYNIYSKKLYKTDTKDNAIDKINSLGIRLGFGNTLTQSNANLPFSVETLNDIIEFNLKLYDKYIKGEEYEYLFDERNKRIEEIKKSKEYLNLNKKEDDELEDEENEDDDINNINLPKPVFYNSKIDKKLDENDEKDNVTNDSDNNEENQREYKIYNDVNYWRIEVNDEQFADLINDL